MEALKARWRGQPSPWAWRGLGAQEAASPQVWIHGSGASMQVGEAFTKPKTEKELKLIASHPPETHAFKVTNYAALDGLLSQLQQSIVPMEGEGSRGLATLWLPPRHSAGGPRSALQPHPGAPSL